MGGSSSTTAAASVPLGFIGLGALFHSTHAATLLKGVEHIIFQDKCLPSQSVLIMDVFKIQ